VSAYVPAPKLQANQTGGRTRSGDRSLLGLEKKYIQVTSGGYIDKPWEPGKQLQSGFNLVTWATSYKLDR